MNEIVTYFDSKFSKVARHVVLQQVLADFRSGKYADRIAYVRSVLEQRGEDDYREAKKQLPVISFCGEFKDGHGKVNLVRHNFLLIFDVDHLTADAMIKAAEQFRADSHILAYWVSPSGNGFKGLIRLDYQNVPATAYLNECYNKAFEDAEAYFSSQFQLTLDPNCSDFSRLCFVCCDANLYINEQAVPFEVDCSQVPLPEQKKTRKTTIRTKSAQPLSTYRPANVKGKNAQHSRDVVSSIIKYLAKRNLSITSSYNEWLRVGFAIADTFNYDLGLKYYLAFCKLDKGRYDEDASHNKLLECYRKGRGDITLGTIVEMARRKGFRMKGSSEDMLRKRLVSTDGKVANDPVSLGSVPRQ